jgi:hypothetical protein
VPVLFAIGLALHLASRIADVVVDAALVCLPAAVSVAVLRYRLWDLDRLVGRTVTYSLVTALAGGPYLLIVPAATRVAGHAGSLAVVDQTMKPTQASLWLRPLAGIRQPR